MQINIKFEFVNKETGKHGTNLYKGGFKSQK
jgi:hypothetical protein